MPPEMESLLKSLGDGLVAMEPRREPPIGRGLLPYPCGGPEWLEVGSWDSPVGMLSDKGVALKEEKKKNRFVCQLHHLM